MIGFGLAVLFVLAVLFLRGAGAAALFDPHAALMVLGGTFAATAISFPLPQLLRLPQLALLAAVGSFLDLPTVVAQLVKASDRVRMSGRAAAMGNAKDLDDAFLRTGLQFVADGFEPQEIRTLLESELQAIRARHRQNVSLLEGMGGYAPTFGILGTVEAMIAILGNLTNPDKLGPEIALAMVATLYGVGFANLVFLPIATRLKKLSEEELRVRQLMIDVIVNIQEGAKPEYIRERLRVSLPPDTRRTIQSLSRLRNKSKQGTQQFVPQAEPLPVPEYDENMGAPEMQGY
ncbi:MAG TPA: MotA/TolQ/ExbB proton channel family protein [Oscillatoriaceae cyanobacterium]